MGNKKDINLNCVVIDKKQCNFIVALLKKITLPSAKEEPIEIELPKDVLENFYFTIVSVCHQTTPVNAPKLQGIFEKKILKGWDYLKTKWLVATKNDNSLVYPQTLFSISSNDIIDILRDDNGKSTIYDPEGRALLLNDLGARMIKLKFNSVQELYERSKGFLIRKNGKGLLQQLSKFKAYSDPVKKKSLFFLSLMKNHSLWIFKDEFNLGPPVDYHEIRGHFRYGSVIIKDRMLLEKILKNYELTQEEDIEIRKAVYEAIMYISRESKISPNNLHYFFWNLFRNCCERKNPHCKNCPASCSLPERYVKLKLQLNIQKCLIANQCMSVNLNNKLIEPKVYTDYY